MKRDTSKPGDPLCEMVAVESSSLRAVGYVARAALLDVTFQHGSTYRYLEVPPEVYHGLLRADSKGRYFNEKVKAAFSYMRLS